MANTIKGKDLVGYSYADGVHWFWGGKEVAIIDEETSEIEWVERKSHFPQEVIDAVRKKKIFPLAKWEITVKRVSFCATRGSILVQINGRTVMTFDDPYILKDGKWVSSVSNDELGKYVASAFWNNYDSIYHYSNMAKQIFANNEKANAANVETPVFQVITPAGILHVYPATDPDYPGVYIDLQNDDYISPLVVLDYTKPENSNAQSAPAGLVCRCWGDPNHEDWTEHVILKTRKKGEEND